MSGSVIKTFADERLLASNLGISFSPSYRFGVAVTGETLLFSRQPQTTKFPLGKLSREKSVTLKKSSFPQANCLRVEFT